MIKTLFSITLLTLLFGCVSFAPDYDPFLDRKSTSAHEKISLLLSGVDLGEYENKESFEEAKPLYIDINASLASAMVRAKNLPVSHFGTAEKAKEELISMIKNCKMSVANLLKIHQKMGLPQSLSTMDTTHHTCDLLVKATQAMKQG